MKRTLTFLTLLTALVAVVPATLAQASRAREAFYRCKDTNGQTQYSNSLPPGCLGRDTEVLSESGSVLRVIEGDASKAARVARDAADSSARLERERQAQRDRMLIDTYLTVADIDRLRDQRLEMVDAQYRVTVQAMKNMIERQTRLEAQIARFKPYNDRPNALPLPDHLAEEIVNMVNSMRVYEESLGKNRREQAEIKRSFESDIKRFKELKGIK
jgi:dynactin complex subunit